MSQRDGFASGFFAGAVFGGVVGGILGAVIASRQSEELIEDGKELINGSGESRKVPSKRRQMISPDGDNLEMESARRSLEDKIAQLNATIDEVRKHLGNVNGSPPQSTGDRSLNKDS
jgi:gas vesicle protein